MKSSDSGNIDNIKSRIQNRLDKPLVLVGLMGAGKTRTGRLLSSALELPFYDSDSEIEKAAAMSVQEIFSRFGEPYFRDGERRVIQRLIESPDVSVIATGGGALMTPETARLIKDKAISLWIQADIEVMAERVGRTDKRPLLRGKDPVRVLKELAVKRYPVYEEADIVVESNNRSAKEQVRRVLEKIDAYLSRGQESL